MLPFSSTSTILLGFLIFLATTRLSTSQGDLQAKTIYDVLKLNGLPIGLLPKGVSNFSIDERGRFEIHLDRACNAKFEDQVHYERDITGNLTYGQIGALSGVSARELFLWFPVKGIRVDIPSSGLIYFDVGVIHKQFSLSLFETPPECQVVDQFNDPDLLEGKRVADAVLKILKWVYKMLQFLSAIMERDRFSASEKELGLDSEPIKPQNYCVTGVRCLVDTQLIQEERSLELPPALKFPFKTFTKWILFEVYKFTQPYKI